MYLFLFSSLLVQVTCYSYDYYSDDFLDYKIGKKNSSLGIARHEQVVYPIEYQHPYPHEHMTDHGMQGHHHHHNNQGAHLDKLTNYFNHQSEVFLPIKKKKKKKFGKKYKFFVPLLITAILKIGHFLPVAKLTLLALFALVLFAKKAFLVSVGSLLLVLYDHLYKGAPAVGLWKDRHHNPPSQPAKQDLTVNDFAEEANKDDWWGRIEGNQSLNINPRDGEKWKRWWAPQIKHNRQEQTQGFKERIMSKLDNLFHHKTY